jgi:membrane protein
MAERQQDDREPGREAPTTAPADPATPPAPPSRRRPRIPIQPTADKGAKRLRELRGRAWLRAARRTVRGFNDDNLSDWAGALTYYGILSIFPGLLLLVTMLRLAGATASKEVVANISQLAPGNVQTILDAAAKSLADSRQGTTGVIAIASLAGALWSASGYIGAFMRASNSIFDVPEGRPIWKKLPIRVGLTVLTGVLLTASAVIAVFTGRLADVVGGLLGIGPQAVNVWNFAKWPVLVLLVTILFDVLYWASPNARQGGFRWVSPGGVLAVVIWLMASAGFALYVTHFPSYNKTYGTLAAVIIFLVWLWISNLAFLLGAEFNSEVQRGRAIQAGHPPEAEPYLQPRDLAKADQNQAENAGLG